jgi:phosphoadenosine phosphosulfate reductase
MSLPLSEQVATLSSRAQAVGIDEFLVELAAQFPGAVTFSSSFSFEDQVITHKILSQQLPIKIFTLDTGRLFTETYSVWRATNEQYQTKVSAYYPDDQMLEEFVGKNGPNAFYESVEKRKECCHIRKVVPLKRALKDQAIWITGLRAEHSGDRHNMAQVEWDESNQIIKYHPILHWTTVAVKQYINDHNIPYNSLHDKGFVSIGCAPCTRAIQPGEDFRAGRWWWEDDSKKECGLHVHPSASSFNLNNVK